MKKEEFKKLFIEIFLDYSNWEKSRENDRPSFQGFIYWLNLK